MKLFSENTYRRNLAKEVSEDRLRHDSQNPAKIVAIGLCLSCLCALSVLPATARLNLQRGQSARENSGPSTGKRIALIIGNSAYSVKPLPNPVNDAADLGSTGRLKVISTSQE